MDNGHSPMLSSYHQLYNRGHPVYFLPPSVPVQYENEQTELLPHGNEEEERKERTTAASSRARLSRACDNCRNGRFKCTKITGEELSPCTKCKSLGESTEECTYLRPRLRPGPLTGVPRASTKVPTMFHEQRNVSAENYKHPDGPPPALGSWNFKNIQPRFGTGANTAISEGVDPRYQDPRRNYERRDLSIHIYDPSGDCRIHAASDKSVAQRSSFLRPMLWVRTENLNSSTSTSLPRDKKHMFVD